MELPGSLKRAAEICPGGRQCLCSAGPQAGRLLGHADVPQVPIHCLGEALTPYADAVNSAGRNSV